jgi:hypothetical protein
METYPTDIDLQVMETYPTVIDPQVVEPQLIHIWGKLWGTARPSITPVLCGLRPSTVTGWQLIFAPATCPACLEQAHPTWPQPQHTR